MAETKVPSLPEIPNGVDGGLRKFLEAVRQVVNVREGLKGDALDANITYRDLVNAGIATSDVYVAPSNGSSPVFPAAVTDSTPLGPVTGVKADAAVESIILTWDQISDNRFSHVEVWRAVSDSRAGLVSPIGTSTGSVFVDKTVSTTQGGGYYYWVRSITTSGAEGPFNVDAFRVTSTILPSTSLTAIKSLPQYKDLAGLPFYYLDANVTVNGVSIPKGTYMWTAVIADATIESAKIKNLSVDKLVAGDATVATITANTIATTMINSTYAYVKSANIESLAANKITTGTLAAGQRITVGADAIHIDAGGYIRTYDRASGEANPRYTEMNSGDVTAYKYFPVVGYLPSKALSQIQAGTAYNAETVVIPGYWEETPKIQVSINSLQVFNAAAANADQKVICAAEDLKRQSTDSTTLGYYTFTFRPTAYITTSASNGTFPIYGGATVISQANPYAEGAWFAGTYNSAGFTIPQFTTSISAPMFINMFGTSDWDGGDAEADFWAAVVTVTLIVNGVVVWSSTPVAQGYTAAGINFSISTGAVPNGPAYFSFAVSGQFVKNNGSYAWYNRGAATRVLSVGQVSAVTSGGSGLASGVLSWLAIGR